MEQFESITAAKIIRRETVETIGRFTVAWNLFEHHYMNNNAHESKIKTLSLSFLDDDDLSILGDLSEAYRISIRRCFNADNRDLNEEIIAMIFYPGIRKAHFGSQFKDYFNNKNNNLNICLCSICRIRNNLLHGEKDIYSINYQIDVLDAAIEVLSYLLKDETLNKKRLEETKL